MAEKLFLVDGHSHFYQAFYGVQRLTAPDGSPVNVIYGFVNMLRRILKQYQPDYIAVAMDVKGPTFRHDLFDEYKATRKPAPPEFLSQMPLIQEILEAYRIPVCAAPGYEADDVLGALARQAEAAGVETWILTSDKDAKQLLTPRVKALETSSGKETTVESLWEEEGIRPDQVIETMSLSGDASDNIPGVPGVGLVTANRLIREWGSLENLLQNTHKVTQPKLREKLERHAEEARLSRELARIRTDAPVRLDLERCRNGPPDEARLRELFERLGFKRFLDEMPPPQPTQGAEYVLVDDAAAFDKFIAELRRQPRFAFDVETTSVAPTRARLVGMSFCWEAGKAYYLPVDGPAGEKRLELKPTLETLKPILGSSDFAKVGQNLKYDAIVMRCHGAPLEGIAFDTMIAAYVLDPTRGRFSLDSLALELLRHYAIPISSLIGTGRKQITMDAVPIARVREYAGEDAELAWRIGELLEKELQSRGPQFEKLFREIEMPLVAVLAEMEYNGIRVDPEALKRFSGELEIAIAKLREQICAEAGTEFNIASPKQLADVLFNRLGLPVRKRTKTGPSTDVDTLEELALEHRIPALVVEYRQLCKLKNTYADALPEMINPDTGRVHASFNQAVTVTGRLSSSDPNLQNIPIRTHLGGRIRAAFIPGEAGWLLLAADYSQIELRLLAHLAEDAALLESFARDEDIHAAVAAQINGVSYGGVTPEMRRMAKAVNFGIVYGLSAFGLAKNLGISVAEADEFIRSYFQRYQNVRRFIDDTIARARERQYVETLWGRRRSVGDINSTNSRQRALAERMAVNAVVQGSAADLIKIAMGRVAARLRASNLRGRMLLQIHDELVFETPAAELDSLRELAVAEMVGAARLRAPIKVNAASGANWLEAK